MILNLIALYFIIGLLINYGVSSFDKIEIFNDKETSDEPLNPHLVILLWPILFASVCYYFLKGLINRWT
ncbi:hypothetical protein [Siansivirga zeaxanthinifaciens]|uniref:Uncharacterized protein n=1 Tax=Siansivirga zeaxanthinifaciens CC-SAMT-1 TaxID=1454006 RepID=A0A0C5W0G5_9FLAO|nr:hypothetical protein [Siansivirga zeaxanthinifaciens]AJR04741.1 hypothetical protein AW14_02950 [Siansivirga zeaxanthinifaciens CC-SAMT-1]